MDNKLVKSAPSIGSGWEYFDNHWKHGDPSRVHIIIAHQQGRGSTLCGRLLWIDTPREILQNDFLAQSYHCLVCEGQLAE